MDNIYTRIDIGRYYIGDIHLEFRSMSASKRNVIASAVIILKRIKCVRIM